MATLGDLVVRIGADTRDLNRSLGRVQRNMRSMTGNFQRLGESMSRSITLPIVAIGAAAVKSAADLEQLETSFVSLTGGAEQAAAMMEQLNEFTAKTPFQIDAVAKSARQLIASGTSVSQVNDQLRFLGDIAATTGNSIDEIAAIFAKVNAKGKVELENLNQLAERGIPIFTALSEATGLPADKLGAGAVSVRQFNQVLKGFADQGGFAAGAMERLSDTATGKFSTAMDNLKLAGASLAESILPKVTKLLDYITGLAQSFTKLDPEIRALIVNFGMLAAAFGPIIAFLPQIVTQIKLIMGLLSGGGIGIAVAAVAALVTTFATLRKEVVTIQDRLNDAQRDANENAAKSIADVRTLVYEFGLQNTSMERKEQILLRLQQISPRYYGHLKDATITVDLLTEATKRYTASIKAQARQEAVREAESEQLKAIADKQREVLEFERRRIEIATKFGKTVEELEGVYTRAEIAQNTWFAGFDFETFDLLGTKIRVGQQDIDRMTQELVDFQNQFNTTGVSVNDLLTDLEGMNRQVIVNTATQKEQNMTMGQFFSMLENVQVQTDRVATSTDKATMSMGEFFSMLENVNVAVENTAVAVESSFNKMADAFSNSVQAQIGNAKSLKEAIVEVAKALIIARLAETKANVLSGASSFAASMGPAAPFVLGGTLAAMMALVNQIQIPALAQGGLAFGPSMALIGDNPNARVDPEVIAPLSKLKDMMGGNQVEVYGRISGNDIYISNSRAATARERYS